MLVPPPSPFPAISIDSCLRPFLTIASVARQDFSRFVSISSPLSSHHTPPRCPTINDDVDCLGFVSDLVCASACHNIDCGGRRRTQQTEVAIYHIGARGLHTATQRCDEGGQANVSIHSPLLHGPRSTLNLGWWKGRSHRAVSS